MINLIMTWTPKLLSITNILHLLWFYSRLVTGMRIEAKILIWIIDYYYMFKNW
jgi:hypothetical protein